MDLYNLGRVDWIASQSLYHALALLGREGLIICYPDSPYVCLGLHDDLDHEIDQDFCQSQGIPLLRRETGGGVVYLDDRQIFYQLVLRRDNPLLPLRRTRFYQKFLNPVRAVCRDLGLTAEIREPADLMVRGRKCSGNACGDIGECVAYVGNLLLEFDFQTMSRVLRLPHKTFRRFLRQAMRSHMTTLADWCGPEVAHSRIAGELIRNFAWELGEMVPRIVDRELEEAARQVGERLTSRPWLEIPGRRPAARRVKIAEGTYLAELVVSPEERYLVLKQDETEIKIRIEPFEEVAVDLNAYQGGKSDGSQGVFDS
jgi:lipoate-protein ligase A